MATQSIYTPVQAARMIGCEEKDLLARIRNGQIKAVYLDNVANYIIKHDDLMSFLRSRKDFETMHKMIVRRLVVVDRDPKVQDFIRMELGRQGFEVRVATTDREIGFLATEHPPDVVCVHLGATTRAKEAVGDGLARLREKSGFHLVLYHDYSPAALNGPEIVSRLRSLRADAVVSIDGSITPLTDAILARFGMKSGMTVKRPLPP